MNRSVITKIAEYGDVFHDKYIVKIRPQMIVNNWWYGWLFLSGRIFFQGRNDRVSERVRNAANEILEPILKDGLPQLDKRSLQRIKMKLSKRIGKGKIGKSRDVEMVISVLEYSLSIPEKNIVANSVSEIKRGNLKQHIVDIMRIVQIGTKISSFYLRDLIDVCKLERYLNNDDYSLIQPIDTWVRQVVERTGIASKNARTTEMQNAIVKACRSENVSPIRFNQGAWYVGANAFDIILEMLIGK